MREVKTFFFSLVLFLSFVSCSEEYDLTNDELTIVGEYEEFVVLYANIDLSSKRNLIRVNRAFSADNFSTNSNLQDSIQFPAGANQVFFHKIYKGDTTTYVCYDTLVEKEHSELFDTKKVLMHVLQADNLLADDLDALQYLIEVQTEKGSITSASTAPVKAASFLRPTNTWDAFGFGDNKFKVNITAPVNAQVFLITADVWYRDFRLHEGEIDIVDHQFSFTVSRYISPQPSDGVDQVSGGVDVLSTVAQSDNFYSALASHIRKNSDTINTQYRKFNGVVFQAICGNSDLTRAISSGASSTGFSDQLVYNNVNNGFGYVSAYNRGVTRKLPVSRATIGFVDAKYPEFRFVK